MLRELASRFSLSLVQRRSSLRKKFQASVRVCFAPEKNPHNITTSCEEVYLSGETVDISETGIAFIVASIRMKEKYLVGQERILKVEIDVGGKKIHMKVLGMRYERVGIHDSTERYLVGAAITEMSPEDRQRYEHVLKNGNKLLRTTGVPSLEMGVID